MTPAEQTAFINAYSDHVADVPDSVVAEFMRLYTSGESIPYREGYTSIMDALGVWHAAIQWQAKQALTTNHIGG